MQTVDSTRLASTRTDQPKQQTHTHTRVENRGRQLDGHTQKFAHTHTARQGGGRRGDFTHSPEHFAWIRTLSLCLSHWFFQLCKSAITFSCKWIESVVRGGGALAGGSIRLAELKNQTKPKQNPAK